MARARRIDVSRVATFSSTIRSLRAIALFTAAGKATTSSSVYMHSAEDNSSARRRRELTCQSRPWPNARGVSAAGCPAATSQMEAGQQRRPNPNHPGKLVYSDAFSCLSSHPHEITPYSTRTASALRTQPIRKQFFALTVRPRTMAKGRRRKCCGFRTPDSRPVQTQTPTQNLPRPRPALRLRNACCPRQRAHWVSTMLPVSTISPAVRLRPRRARVLASHATDSNGWPMTLPPTPRPVSASFTVVTPAAADRSSAGQSAKGGASTQPALKKLLTRENVAEAARRYFTADARTLVTLRHRGAAGDPGAASSA